MEKLEKLFESLDDNVFTADLKESLKTQFNEAVEQRSKIIANEEIELLNEKSEEHIAFLDEKSEEHIAFLDEKSEEHIEFLNEKAEEFVEIEQKSLSESLNGYLDRVVEEFVEESKESLCESLSNEKSEMIIDAFDAMLVSTGVELSRIVEAKDESTPEFELSESREHQDALVDELIQLKEENEKLIKMGVIAEMTEDLSIIESQKFTKLANMVDFTKSHEFVEKLETIKESVTSAPSAPSDRVAKRNRSKNNLRHSHRLVESAKSVDVSDYSHLI